MAKTPSNDRAAKAKKQLKAHQRAERRGSFMIVGVCAVVALLIVGAAAYRPVANWWDLRKFDDIDLASIGAPATVCGPEMVIPATGEQDHRDTGSIEYTTSPPMFGPHRSVPAAMERKFYGWDDRSELEQLVHNSEHGYTFLWYDQTVADNSDEIDEIEGIGKKLQGTDNFRLKFKALPWYGADEAEGDQTEWATDMQAGMEQIAELTGNEAPQIEGGVHVALTHWAVDPKPEVGDDPELVAPTAEGEEQPSSYGIVQYCSAPSGEALKEFMLRWPYTNSTEPNAM